MSSKNGVKRDTEQGIEEIVNDKTSSKAKF